MKMRRRTQIILSLVIQLLVIPSHLHARFDRSQGNSPTVANEVRVGVILDLGSWVGKTIHSCITMAISDFYAVNSHHKTRIALHTRDSKGEPLQALSAALDLLENGKVQAIIGLEMSFEAKVLALLGDKANVPILSFSTSPSSSTEYPYLVQITQDASIQFECIASIVDSFKWRDVAIIYEDTDEGREILPYLVESFQDKNIQIACRSAISPSATDNQILEELHKQMSIQTTVFVVHMSPPLASRLFLIVKRFGMMSEGYAWIITDKTMNLFRSLDWKVIESLQGALGIKSYIPTSTELHNFTRRWKNEVYKDPTIEVKHLNMFGIWAYDAIWALAKAFERVGADTPAAMDDQGTGLNSVYLANISVSEIGRILLNELLKIRFKGLSGEFQILNGKLASNALEILNLIGKGKRRVGFWTSTNGITKVIYSSGNRKYGSSSNSLETIIWPGGSATIPKGWMMRMGGKKLRIGVPTNSEFKELVSVDRNPETNETTVSGYCIDAFNAAMGALPFAVTYEFIPFVGDNGKNLGSYNDLTYQVYLQKYDGAVGDITIMANRSQYVDFTIPFTDEGVGLIARKPMDNKNMWIFLKPLDGKLWLATAACFILTGFVVWVIEHPINEEFQGSLAQQIGTVCWFSFSALVFAHRERLLSNLSKFVVIIWVFILLILTSSYTATLSSLLTVQQIQESKRDYIGYHSDFFGGQRYIPIANKVNFKDDRLKPYTSQEEYIDALSKGSKNGGVDAIADEIPYIKVFLAKYPADYAMIAYESTSNGFGFVFQKGSPLVPEVSRAIAKLRAEGKLAMLEKSWFNGSFFMPQSSVSHPSNTLNLESFSGLFLISGVTSAITLLIFLVCFLRERFAVQNHILTILAQGQPLLFLMRYIFTRNVT
ncbi:unnamed protein product [Ilex paraguariensis]|uniref:Glutamate receptor n=1 Tax=Ilex paraguariensis TaxID=185542 RepID=A0ABC8RZQ0_9AQUA